MLVHDGREIVPATLCVCITFRTLRDSHCWMGRWKMPKYGNWSMEV